ncbi:MAG: AMP-binding protein [Moraxellaceae bacterium]
MTTRTTADRPWLKTYQELGLSWDHIPALPKKSLADYIEEHVAAIPEHTALVFLGQTISYRTLDEQANRLANALQAAGCGKGDVLAIHLPNTPQYILGFVAAAKLGMVITSISALLTPPEIAYQANDAKVRALLSLDLLFNAAVKPVLGQIPSLKTVLVSSATELLPNMPAAQIANAEESGVKILGLAATLAAASAERVHTTVEPDDVIFLQYTGGTTGKPKGAQLTLRNIIGNNLQVDIFNRYEIGKEVFASAFPMFHVGGTAITFNALRCAATYIVIPDPRNVDHFVAEMKRFNPTALMAVPALYQMMLANPDFRALDFSKLKMAITAAAPFAVEELKKVEAIIGAGKMSEVYGMTETGPVQTCNPPQKYRLGYVGFPIPGTELRLVDPENPLVQVPLGEPGEIMVSGPQVMKGYFGDVGVDALREIDGLRWMMTGDIAVMDEDGYLRICDRSKDMIIVGGYKVFSVEVEGKIASLPFVAMSAMVGRPDADRPGNEVAQLYVQLKPGLTESEDALREQITAFCRANTAPYKVPKEIFFIPAIPLTSVGKIDKKALRQK